jgi:hypothetical protein
VSSVAAALDQVTDELYTRHTSDAGAASAARREYELRRGKVHQDDELWEPWSAAFVEWYVVERIADGTGIATGSGPNQLAVPPAAQTFRELVAAGDPRAPLVGALVTSHRSLFEITGLAKGTIEVTDLLGGAVFAVDEARTMLGVEAGDVAELRLVGAAGQVLFGRTFIYHPRQARDAIVDRAHAMLAKGSSRRDVIDAIAHQRTLLTRYRHMPPHRVYELGSRVVG